MGLHVSGVSKQRWSAGAAKQEVSPPLFFTSICRDRARAFEAETRAHGCRGEERGLAPVLVVLINSSLSGGLFFTCSFLHGDGVPADCEVALRYYKVSLGNQATQRAPKLRRDQLQSVAVRG